MRKKHGKTLFWAFSVSILASSGPREVKSRSGVQTSLSLRCFPSEAEVIKYRMRILLSRIMDIQIGAISFTHLRVPLKQLKPLEGNGQYGRYSTPCCHLLSFYILLSFVASVLKKHVKIILSRQGWKGEATDRWQKRCNLKDTNVVVLLISGTK